METVYKFDIPLLIDDECSQCGRLVARSNIKHRGYVKLCGLCYERSRMAEPTPKHPDIENVLTKLTGRSRVESIKNDKCSFCGGDASTFRNELSRREYVISGFCQKCQDSVFGKD